MNRPNLTLLSVPFLVLSLAACPPDGGPGDGGPDEATLDTLFAFMGELAEECSQEELGFVMELDPDYADALLMSRAQYEESVRSSFERLRESKLVEYRPENIQPCYDALQAGRCSALFTNDGPEACNRILVGLAQIGEECATQEECAEGYCDGADDRCGACVAYAGEGESCEELFCGPGLDCNSDEVCVTETEGAPPPQEPKAGDSCTQQSGCGNVATSGLVCVTEGDSSTCVRASVVELGGECDLLGLPNATRFCKGVLSTTYCDADIFSGETTGTCVARPSTGDECGGLALCNSFESDCVDEVCVAVRAEGESCGEGPACELGTSCREGICVRGETSEREPLRDCAN